MATTSRKLALVAVAWAGASSGLLVPDGAAFAASAPEGLPSEVRSAAGASAPLRAVARPRHRPEATGQPFAPTVDAWHLARIKAPQAAELVAAAPGVVIAIVDSGVDPLHPAFDGKMVDGANTRDPKGDTVDSYGHGTHIAGVAAARPRPGSGVVGVAPKAMIMPMRVTDRTGRAQSAGIAQAITWAADHGARVINLSLEGVSRNAAIRDAAAYAWRRGALVVAPAGNCGCVETTPSTPYIVSVAATDRNDRLAAFSSTGAFVHLTAPGVDVPTTSRYGLELSDSGTSMASAVVSGVAALMFAANTELTPAAVSELLARTAVDPDGQSLALGQGRGRVDALAAVRAALDYRRPVEASADGSASVGAQAPSPSGLASK
jgi:subtilisin family serine protease